MARPIRSTIRPSSRGSGRVAIVLGVLVLIVMIYFAIGAYATSRWMKPRRSTDFSTTPAAFNLEYQDVRFPSRDSGIEIAGWWIPRAGSSRAIVMVPGIIELDMTRRAEAA